MHTVQPFAVRATPARTIADQEAALNALFAGYRVQLRGRPAPRSDVSADQLLAEISRIVDGQQNRAA